MCAKECVGRVFSARRSNFADFFRQMLFWALFKPRFWQACVYRVSCSVMRACACFSEGERGERTKEKGALDTCNRREERKMDLEENFSRWQISPVYDETLNI